MGQQVIIISLKMVEKITSTKQAQALLDKHDTWLFDCDGVLWHGSELLPHARETIELLKRQGKQLIFVTNNSTKSRATYRNKFEKLGFQVDTDDIFGSAFSAAVYLDRVIKFPKDKKVLVVGEQGIEDELHALGYQTVMGSDPQFRQDYSEALNATVSRDPEIGCVLVGLDTHVNYYKVAYAQAQLEDPNTLFLATNIDSTFPSHGRLFPGAGTIIQAVATAARRQPTASLGKPSDAMMSCIKARFEFDPSRAIMVGDRLNTDMAFGRRGGLSTFMVLTGVDTEAAIAESDTKPDFLATKLGDLYELLS